MVERRNTEATPKSPSMTEVTPLLTAKTAEGRIRGWRESSDQLTVWNMPERLNKPHPKSTLKISTPDERRRQRQLLRESGDYLGVQGVNPHTGRLDVLTPTPSNSSKSGASVQTGRKLHLLEKQAQTARRAYRDALDAAQNEAETILLRREEKKEAKREKQKEAIRQAQSKVKWRRDPRQWSSAQEPGLSPITQSVGTATPEASSPRRRSVAKGAEDEVTTHLTDALAEIAMEKEDAEASDSSDTVIHTPARRRSSVFPAAATEGLSQGHMEAALSNMHVADETDSDDGLEGEEEPPHRLSSEHVVEGGRMCLHTHHHHYWLRPGTDEVPSRVDVEYVAELQRLSPMDDTPTRHYVNKLLARKAVTGRAAPAEYQSVATQTDGPERKLPARQRRHRVSFA